MKIDEVANRLPLLWLLVPYSTGIVFSAYLFPSFTWQLAVATATISILAVYHGVTKRLSWHVSLPLALFFAGAVYINFENEKNKVRMDFPAREARLELSIKRIFTERANLISGLATIVKTDEHLDQLSNRPVFFSLQPPAEKSRVIIGSRFSSIGILKRLDTDVPNQESFNQYLTTSGQWGSFTHGHFIAETKAPDFAHRSASRIREWIEQSLTNGIDPESEYTRSFLAIILGKKKELSSEQQEIFLKSGSMHLFAISGLHIGIIATCFVALFKLFRLNRRAIPFATVFAIAGFVVVSGGGASAWRAFLMVSCFFLCQTLKIQKAPLNALILSALICLLISPRQIFQAGFQMSYAVVLAILLFGLPLAQRTKDNWKPFALIPRPLWTPYHKVLETASRYTIDVISISLAASTVSGLLSVKYFGTLPLLGALSNAFILPLASLSIVAGFCSLFCSALFLYPLNDLFNHAAITLLISVQWMLNKIASISIGYQELTTPPPFILTLVSMILSVFLFGYSKAWKVPLTVLWLLPITLLSSVYFLAFAWVQ